MCSVFGIMLRPRLSQLEETEGHIKTLLSHCGDRGRDGRGWAIQYAPNVVDEFISLEKQTEDYYTHKEHFFNKDNFLKSPSYVTAIGNFRAEPTTEYVENKQLNDQQPYQCNGWVIVHNGTIANDKELRTNYLSTKIDSAAIAELLDSEMNANHSLPDQLIQFAKTVRKLKGSYAIIAFHTSNTNAIFTANNYRPLWSTVSADATYIASEESMLPNIGYAKTEAVKPYSATLWVAGMPLGRISLLPQVKEKALAVCSGGLDSVTAAAYMKAQGFDTTLLHFRYGCRAEKKEEFAVSAVADALDLNIVYKNLPMWDKKDSPLLNEDVEIAGGEEGAEFASEWVPARNLVMLAIATAYAEANGFTHIVLGNNLEEAGAYPDNEPEFYNIFNKLLPYAVGDGKQVQVVQPVGHMMKHEIVKLANELNAPLHLTWSCYKQGEKHCGKCGPCFMRKTAFEINNIPETIEYEVDNE